jgi:hypothetical protein
VIAHALGSENPSRCSRKDALRAGAPADCEFCERWRAAKTELRARIGGGESKRGSYVYGVHDGVARWIPLLMGRSGCFHGKDMAAFAATTGDRDRRFGREQVAKIGVVADERICPWNPAQFRHEVPTLLIKGSRDSVAAGCQAEDFFLNALKEGRRVLLEFRGLGHDLSVGNLYEGSDPSIWSKRYAGIIDRFVRMAEYPAKFRADTQVRAELQRLKARDRSADPQLLANCGEQS